jgi:hypothetical protein
VIRPQKEVSLFRCLIEQKADVSVRWVNAIWTALERTRGRPASRAPSVRSERPLSQITRSDAGGSASTQYTPYAGGPTSQNAGSIYQPHRAIYATDDQVVVTSGGFVTPLTQRGSRRLAAGGLERNRSLRRVASEADLSEDALILASTQERRSAPDLLELPLTLEIARSRPGSRDFTFAGGVAPPPLMISPPPEYFSPTTRTLQTIPESMSQSMATAAEILSMDAAGERYETPFEQSTSGAVSTYFTPAGQSDTRSTYHTAGQQDSTTIAYTARETAYDDGSVYGNVPQVQITQASASHSADSDEYRQSTITYGLGNNAFDNLGNSSRSVPASQYTTARETVYSTAGTHLDNTSSVLRDSVSSYHSAPPPVPSKYGTASERSGRSEPIRYQLHDPDVQWATASPGRSGVSDSGYQTARPPTTRMGTAEEGMMSYACQSAMSTASPRSTGYETAPPPPISRSSVRSEKLSFRSDDQERAETGTYISEPESDVGLLADLERRSSYGSVAPMGRSTKSKSYFTAVQWKSESGRTPLGTAPENTLYLTARESAYTTAPSSFAEVATARGTQE